MKRFDLTRKPVKGKNRIPKRRSVKNDPPKLPWDTDIFDWRRLIKYGEPEQDRGAV